MPTGGGFAFSPFRIDVRARLLLRDGKPVPLAARHYNVLLELASHPNEVVTKERLTKVGWPDHPIGDNSVVKVVGQIRHILDKDRPEGFIATESRVGYRFVVSVTRVEDTLTLEDLDDALRPHLAFVDGRAGIETLTLDRVISARATLEQVLGLRPNDARFHAAFANACILVFESTRTSANPDLHALQLAVTHAWKACRLQPGYAEGWATLGFVLERIGDRANAVAALLQSVSLEPGNWRHHLRHSAGSAGEARLSAARRTLELWPDSPLAHFLAATVYVARGALAMAEREVDAGLAVMPEDQAAAAPFAALGLHWLKGLLCLARGDEDAALAAFARELALEPLGHIYGREMAANACYAIGAVHRRRGNLDAAREAFTQAIARVPLHPLAHAGLALVTPEQPRDILANLPDTIERSVASAVLLAATDDAAGAVRVVSAALTAAPSGNAGWLIPIEPLLAVDPKSAEWMPVLALLRARAA